MKQPIRFLHSSDFHLERPLGGLSEVPDHLRAALIDAPYRAAERVFDAAIKEHVDFLVLSGDLVDPQAAGPRGLVFLWQQFQRLADKNIRAYWISGRADNFERFVEPHPPGDHVIRFPLHRVQRIVHTRDGQPVAQILGASAAERKRIRAADFHAEPGPLFALALAYGKGDAESLATQAIDYWALGGAHDRRALATGPVTAQYAGSPQGRRFEEAGPHGCTLVQVDEERAVRTSFIPTDAARYLHERVVVDPATTAEGLHAALSARVEQLLTDPFGPDLLIDWKVVGSKALAAELDRGKLAIDLSARLRVEHGQRRPAAWTVSLASGDKHALSAALYEEDTVLGEFLRTVRHYADHPDDPLAVETFLAERHAAGNLDTALAIDDLALRQRVLAEVARLGVELLSPEGERA